MRRLMVSKSFLENSLLLCLFKNLVEINVSSLSDNLQRKKIYFPVNFLFDLSFSPSNNPEIPMRNRNEYKLVDKIAGKNLFFIDNCYLRDLHRSKGEEKTREPRSRVLNCNIQSQVPAGNGNDRDILYLHLHHGFMVDLSDDLVTKITVFRSTINSPPPSYSEVNSELPPNYEDVVKEDKMVNNIPL